jgi:hypothetical protein
MLDIACIITVSMYIADRPPQVKALYESTLVARPGSSVRMQCPVHGEPRPLVSWTKDGYDVHLGWNRYRSHRAVLQILDVHQSDTGLYTCTASNGFGTVTASISLQVVGEYYQRGLIFRAVNE